MDFLISGLSSICVRGGLRVSGFISETRLRKTPTGRSSFVNAGSFAAATQIIMGESRDPVRAKWSLMKKYMWGLRVSGFISETRLRKTPTGHASFVNAGSFAAVSKITSE
ncbi:MAG TPA: hypothetical protein VMH01_07665 [Puia sp.]|nr:hypothetical protein [Puia sp.]